MEGIMDFLIILSLCTLATAKVTLQSRFGKKGIKSEMYLERYRGESLLSRKRLRCDEYRPIQGIIVKKIADTTNKIPFNACVFS